MEIKKKQVSPAESPVALPCFTKQIYPGGGEGGAKGSSEKNQ